MTRTLKFALCCLLVSSAFAAPAKADDACAADRQKFCADAKGIAAKMSCMKSHEADLSDACKAQRSALKQANEEVAADCKPDVEKLCPGIKPGAGRIHDCLKGHAADLAPACKDAIAKKKELAETIHPGCKPDADKFCQGIQPGGGRILACLESHQADLSAACKAHVEKREAKAATQGAPAPAK
jgi:hypothetical protein